MTHPIFALLFDGDTQRAQMMMFAGFVMLGWVLTRRTLGRRKRVHRDEKAANRALKRMREQKEPAVPLCDAPVETQRWQTAMFDLQRELKAELDTRIVIVQTLLQQLDQRIARLDGAQSTPAAIASDHHEAVTQLLRTGYSATEIANKTGLPIGDIEMTIATLRPHSLE